MSCTPWQSVGSTAGLQLNDLRATADLTRPCDGLADVVVAGQPIAAARLLGVAAFSTAVASNIQPLENHVRGVDLLVAYKEPGQWPVRVDALWRATTPRATDRILAMVDLIVSVRTESLDSHPELLVQSVVPAGEVLGLRISDPMRPQTLTVTAPMTIQPADGMGGLLFRLPGTDLTYVEMVHPVYFQCDELSPCDSGGNLLRIAHRLFRTCLEKGVILRRVRLKYQSPEIICAGLASFAYHSCPKQWLLYVDRIGVAFALLKLAREYQVLKENPHLLALPVAVGAINLLDVYLGQYKGKTWPHAAWHLSAAAMAAYYLSHLKK